MRCKTKAFTCVFALLPATLSFSTATAGEEKTKPNSVPKHNAHQREAITSILPRETLINSSDVALNKERKLSIFETTLENGKPYYRFNAASDDRYSTYTLKQGTNLKVIARRARSSRCDEYAIDIGLYRRINYGNGNVDERLVKEVQDFDHGYRFCSDYATDPGTELTVQSLPYDAEYVIIISKKTEFEVHDFSYVLLMENDYVHSSAIQYNKELAINGGQLTNYYHSLVPRGKKGWYSVFLHAGWSLKIVFNHFEICPDKELYINLYTGGVSRNDLKLVRRVSGNMNPIHCSQENASRGAQLKIGRVPFTGLYTVQLGGKGPANMDSVKSEFEIQTDSKGSLGYTGTLDCSRRARKRKLTKSHQRWKAVLHAGRTAEFLIERTGNCNGDPLTIVLYYGSGRGKNLEYIAHHQGVETSRNCPDGSTGLDPARMKIRQLPYSGEYTIEVFRGDGVALDDSPIPYKIKIFSRDRDGDGIPDACDRCPFTDLSKDISVLHHDVPGVKNVMIHDDPGCSLNEAMLNLLRTCSNHDDSAPSERQALFRKCMRSKLGKILGISTDLNKVMKHVSKTSIGEVEGECGNVLLSVRSTCGCGDYDMTLIDPNTGNRQYLVNLELVSPHALGFSAVAYDSKNSIIYASECCEDRRLIGFDPSTFKQVSSYEFPAGSMWDLEFVGDTLYGAWRPTDAAQWIGIVTMNATSPPLDFDFLVDPEYRQSREFIAYHKPSSTLWTKNSGDLAKYNATTGALIQENLWVIHKSVKIPINDFKFGPGGFLYALRRDPRLFIKVDPTTLKATKVKTFNKWGYEGLTCFTL